MPGIDFRQARSQVRLREVLELAGFVPSWRWQDQVRGPCPVHESRSPRSRSFAAHLGKNLWHCFRCDAGGNALDLWVTLTRLPLHAAVLDLYGRLGRGIPWLPRPASSLGRPERGEKRSMSDP